MSWLATKRLYGPNRGLEKFVDHLNDKLICTGSLVCEFQPTGPEPLRLINYQSNQKWLRNLTIFRNADGSLAVNIQQGSNRAYGRLSGFGIENQPLQRLTYMWDSLRSIGWVICQNLETDELQSMSIKAPPPIPSDDALSAVGAANNARIDPCVKTVALADHKTTVGPSANIESGALVRTLRGMTDISSLKAGDEVVTLRNGTQKIRQIVRQVEPVFSSTEPIHLCAPFFGLTQDLIVAASQRLLVSGSRTEYEFGSHGMLIEARELVGLPGAIQHGSAGLKEKFQVLLDEHDCIQVNGTWIESVYLGPLADQAKILENTLFGSSKIETLPIHARRILPVLRNYEKRALFGSMIA